MKKLLPLVALACVFGCNSAEKDPISLAGSDAIPPGVPGQGGVAPLASGAVGGVTPMSGAESVGGGGMGGLGSAAKGQAMGAAAAAGGGSAAQMGEDGP